MSGMDNFDTTDDNDNQVTVLESGDGSGDRQNVTPTKESCTTDAVFNTIIDTNLVPTPSPGVTIDAKVGGSNLVNRKLVILENFGKRVRVRLKGSSARGYDLNKGDQAREPIGAGVDLEILEANADNEIKVYIQERS